MMVFMYGDTCSTRSMGQKEMHSRRAAGAWQLNTKLRRDGVDGSAAMAMSRMNSPCLALRPRVMSRCSIPSPCRKNHCVADTRNAVRLSVQHLQWVLMIVPMHYPQNPPVRHAIAGREVQFVEERVAVAQQQVMKAGAHEWQRAQAVADVDQGEDQVEHLVWQRVYAGAVVVVDVVRQQQLQECPVARSGWHWQVYQLQGLLLHKLCDVAEGIFPRGGILNGRKFGSPHGAWGGGVDNAGHCGVGRRQQ